DDWTRRHEVYRLFRRAVESAADRGFRRQPGETPLEFGAGASRSLAAPVLDDVAGAFDRARYGRHYPGDDALRGMRTRLEEWEQASPIGEERGPATVAYAGRERPD